MQVCVLVVVLSDVSSLTSMAGCLWLVAAVPVKDVSLGQQGSLSSTTTDLSHTDVSPVLTPQTDLLTPEGCLDPQHTTWWYFFYVAGHCAPPVIHKENKEAF